MKIVFTGGSGRFGRVFKKLHEKKNILYPTSNQLNIKNYKNIKMYLSKYKPNYFIHAAAISRPMEIHEKNNKKHSKISFLIVSSFYSFLK